MKWKPTTLSAGERFVASVLTSRSAQDKANLANFRAFVEINNISSQPFEEQIALIGAQMRSHQLKGTTIVSYLYSIISQIYLNHETYTKVKRVISALEYMCRHDEVRRAPELTGGQYEQLLTHLTCPFIRVAVEMMYGTALRAADLSDIAPWEVHLKTGNQIRILVVGGKNHRKFSQREVIECAVSPFVFQYLRTVKATDATRILNVTASEISAAITKVLSTHMTSYSIRNFRIHQIIESETDNKGVVDWSRVQAKTKHRGTGALKSAYHWKKQ